MRLAYVWISWVHFVHSWRYLRGKNASGRVRQYIIEFRLGNFHTLSSGFQWTQLSESAAGKYTKDHILNAPLTTACLSLYASMEVADSVNGFMTLHWHCLLVLRVKMLIFATLQFGLYCKFCKLYSKFSYFQFWPCSCEHSVLNR